MYLNLLVLTLLQSKIYTYPCESVGLTVALLDSHSVGVSGPLQSIRRPWDIIHFLEAMNKSYQPWNGPILRMVQFSKRIDKFLFI